MAITKDDDKSDNRTTTQQHRKESITMPNIDEEKVKVFAKKGATKALGIVNDFKTFISRGNVIDLAIGIIIGTAFTAIVTSFVNDIIGPIIALATGQASFANSFVVLRYGKTGNSSIKYPTIAAAQAEGAVTWNYGRFIETIINFFITALFVFLIVKFISSLHREKKATSTDWPCPKCKETVKLGAVRCPHCCADPIYPEPPEPAEIAQAAL